MTSCRLAALRARIDSQTFADQGPVIDRLTALAALPPADRVAIGESAVSLVETLRTASKPGLMEVFLSEYGLSTDEGIALMCLAEALLRVPDAETIDALIEDKIAPSDWSRHLAQSTSPLVNTATWALMLTGRVLREDGPSPVKVLKNAVKRLGEPLIRAAVGTAMREMGRQFVLGENIASALERAENWERKGGSYSYDMLGEAARTASDANRYFDAYAGAIDAIGQRCQHNDVAKNPGISIKLSALHPRYEVSQRARVMTELVPKVRALAVMARDANMGFTIDAEEQDRLALSMDVITAVLTDPGLAGWDGFGVVVQAYGLRAGDVIDYLYTLAAAEDRRITIRLVKGAYWDTEIKRAQVEGLTRFPVFTSKAATDISYLGNARKLLAMRDRIYPQFATHNAHSVTAVQHMAGDSRGYEFQRLHGMGESLYGLLHAQAGIACRIYAPVGAHRDLLAYLVRRLLENGANSSFVNQIVDDAVPAHQVVADPFNTLNTAVLSLRTGPTLFSPERVNSAGVDLTDSPTLDQLECERAPFRHSVWHAEPITVSAVETTEQALHNPAQPDEVVGTVANLSPASIPQVVADSQPWCAGLQTRARVLEAVAEHYEQHRGEIIALLAREAGKTLPDCIAELREAVDFLRYYAAQVRSTTPPPTPAGRFVCISPWNFPLAIFTGQISAALAVGNGVLAKPAEQTPLIGALAIRLFHRAGVPLSALQYLPGDGAGVGGALTACAGIDGVAFTGSTQTAHTIQRCMAEYARPGAPLIAETGGLNAMVVDSTALMEQAVMAVMESAFQSAGQRCSALRCVYVQEDIAESFIHMLKGAMDEWIVADPWHLSTDCGPVIDPSAQQNIDHYISRAASEGRLLHQTRRPNHGYFVPPTLIEVAGIERLEREIFGPVLHLARFSAQDLKRLCTSINASGYGLTFGLQTRIDDRVQYFAQALTVGNIYVNRNQVGAVVGSQPFGGEGLSGTGPKAGGPHYLARFCRQDVPPRPWDDANVDANTGVTCADNVEALQAILHAALEHKPPPRQIPMPGPTGESNVLSLSAREPVLCLGPGEAAARRQQAQVMALGGVGVAVSGPSCEAIDPAWLRAASDFSAVLWWGDEATAKAYAVALAERTGPIRSLLRGAPIAGLVCYERHLCVDTTASGGNAALLNGDDH